MLFRSSIGGSWIAPTDLIEAEAWNEITARAQAASILAASG